MGEPAVEHGEGIAVDGEGRAYVTGLTDSANYPTTPGAFDTTFNGAWDAFVTKLNASGSALAYSTFLGGTNSDFGDWHRGARGQGLRDGEHLLRTTPPPPALSTEP